MAHISSNEDGVTAVSFGNHIRIFDFNSNTAIVSYVSELSKDDTDSNDANFLQHIPSPNKKYFAAITGDKKLLVWNIVEKSQPVTYILRKRPTCLCFCNKEDTVLVGDKTGDVYRCELKNNENTNHQLLLGHLSMVLDVAVSHDDKFVISVDRDEKIRVSLYPNAYNIHNYCLGHTQLVSTIAFTSDELLISGSGDGTLRMWKFKDGCEVSRINVNEQLDTPMKVISKLACDNDTIALMGEECKVIMFFNCEGESLTHEYSHDVAEQPYDICYTNGKLLVLIRHPQHHILCLEKVKNIYTERYISICPDDDDFKSTSLPDSKTYTDLLKLDALKRINIEITPESTINNVIMTPESSLLTTESTIAEVVSIEA